MAAATVETTARQTDVVTTADKAKAIGRQAFFSISCGQQNATLRRFLKHICTHAGSSFVVASLQRRLSLQSVRSSRFPEQVTW
jgi:hypothetical protein